MANRKKNLPSDDGHINSGYYQHNSQAAGFEGYIPYDSEDNIAGGGGDYRRRNNARDDDSSAYPPGYMPYEPEDYDDDFYRRRQLPGGLYPSVPEYRDTGDFRHPNGDGGGVDDRWRTAYPYVPTSYSANSSINNNTATLPMNRLKSKEAKALEKNTGGSPSPPLPPDKTAAAAEVGEGGREQWGSQWEFIFSCIGLSVGIGNVWRFPTLAYENGGGSFLIPYFIILLVIGKPMYYMELALGQFVQQGPVGIWKICPLGYGIGIAQVGKGRPFSSSFFHLFLVPQESELPTSVGIHKNFFFAWK